MSAVIETLSYASSKYINREFSWLQFNRRVLAEAENSSNPILERLKFLAIFESNLDEFYMVRVSGLIETLESGVDETAPDKMTPAEQLEMIQKIVFQHRAEAANLWESLKQELAENQIRITQWKDLGASQQEHWAEYFKREIFPLCTPILLHPTSAQPHISNRSLNIAVEIADESGELVLVRVKVPTIIPRLLEVERNQFLLLEELIRSQLSLLFPRVNLGRSWMFRVVRDADIELKELEAADLITAVEKSLKARRLGDPVLLEVEEHLPDPILEILLEILNLEEQDVLKVRGQLGMDMLWQLSAIPKSGLKYASYTPTLVDPLAHASEIFKTIRQQDLLIQHPFDSFRTIQEFVASAAQDPNVLGIKMTLYRVGSSSPIVEALLEAAENGKQVAVMVELKARFDESNNLVWARALERAGVHVSYGFTERKVHCKLCLIVRREHGETLTYAHIGTGNYNPSTARNYTDLGLLTANPEITQDVSELFNTLTGFSKQTEYRRILVAPYSVRDGIIQRISQEISSHVAHGGGHIIFKLNSLVDPEVIEALYEASIAGVKVDLIVRGVCCLRAGVPGLSENIQVRSIVGRFLEHSRVYWFANQGNPIVFIGSADMMRRNLDRRVEVLVPIDSPPLQKLLRDEVLESYLKDNTNAWLMNSDGTYRRVQLVEGKKEFSAQKYLMSKPLSRLQFKRTHSPRTGVLNSNNRP